MDQEQFWILFSKQITGEISDEERSVLDKLMEQYPEYQFAAQHISDFWKTKGPVDLTKAENAYALHLHRMDDENFFEQDDAAFSSVKESDKQTDVPVKKKIWLHYGLSIAASILLVIILIKGNYQVPQQKLAATNNFNEVSTRPGSKTKINLPDGTIVWLNAGSKLSYEKDFGINNREVTLSGEGYFDVKSDPDQPFIIHAQSINIKVIGTAFNVKAYPDDKVTETSLIRGQVEITLNNRPMDKIILSPNEKLVVENESLSGELKPKEKIEEPIVVIQKMKPNSRDSSINEIQWVENKLVFDNELLGDIVVKMNRWYNVDISIKNEELRDRRFTGSFENENIDQAMEALMLSTQFKWERTGNKIIIHH